MSSVVLWIPARSRTLTGAKGALDQKEEVYKVSIPRNDLAVIVGGVKISPAMGFSSWAAFKHADNDDMVMGDLVLTQEQISPAMDALNNGLQVTALHNHFVTESPRIMFMHIAGVGLEEKLADAVGKVFSTIKARTRDDAALPPIDPAHSTLDAIALDATLGVKGHYRDGVYKFVVGRKTQMPDVEVGNQMGVNTWGAFGGSDRVAVVDGDVAMRESEVQNVLKTLRRARINVVAIHQAHDWRRITHHFPPLLRHRTKCRSRQRLASSARTYTGLATRARMRQRLRFESPHALQPLPRPALRQTQMLEARR